MNEKIVADTSILIALYNKGYFKAEFLDLNRSATILLSVVTLNEFLRGAHDKTSKNLVAGFLEITQDRLITPTEQHWIECGRLSEHLLKGAKRSKEEVLLLQNDILIALGTRDAGAKLITCDQDFKLLKNWIKVECDFWTT